MKNAAILLDRTLDFLNGKVKRVTKRTFDFKGDSKVLKEQYIKEYNQRGQRTKTIYLNTDGSVKLEQISEFDKNGYKIGYKNYDKNKFIDSEGNYEVDTNGNILKKYFNGNLEEAFSYDSQGRLMEQIYAYSRDRIIYHYIDNSQFVNEQTTFMRGEKKYIIKYTNDSRGNILKAETFRYPTMEIIHTQIGIINNRGDVTEEYVNLADGKKVNWKKFEYEYDSKENWIQRICTNVESNSKTIDDRQIEYF